MSKEIAKRAIGLITEVQKKGSCDFIKGSDFVARWARIFWKNSTKDLDCSVKEAVLSAYELERATRPRHCSVRDGDVVRLLANFKQKTRPGVRLDCYFLTAEARVAACAGDCERAFGLYVSAFHEARYRGGILVKAICVELMALCCFLHSLACKHKSPRGSYWTVARYVRDWCALMDICHDVWSLDDEAFVNWGCRAFEQLIRAPEIG